MPFGPQNTQRVLLELAALDKWDYDDALRRILRLDSEILSVERVNFWLLRSEPLSISCEQGFVRSLNEYERGQLLFGESYPRYFAALREEKVIAAVDAHQDQRTSEFSSDYLPAQGIGAMMDVPVWSRGRLEGVLCHEHVGGPRHWQESDTTLAMAMALAIGNALEVRERRRAEEALRRAEEQKIRLAAREQAAREQIQARDQFLSIASHELYTPLTSLQLAVQILHGTFPDDAAAQKRLALVDRQVQRLIQLVSGLLDVTRLQAGRFEISVETFDLASLAADVAARLGELATREGCEIRLCAPRPVVGRWDRSRIDQVITNLISNAIKFSSGLPIDLAVELVACQGAAEGAGAAGEGAAAAGTARVTVKDRGIGIPPDMLTNIFRRFERAVSSRSYGGLGLGLYIVQAIAEAHGGRVEIESEVQKGTTVVVELPIARADGAVAEAAAS